MKMQHLQIWFNKISIQFAHSKLCSLCPSLFLLASVCSFYFNFNLSLSRSPILCCLSCPLLQQSDTDSYHSLFFFFFQHLHINQRTFRLPSQCAGNGEKMAKAWLWCQFINAAPREIAWMKAPMLLENYPPSRGKSFVTQWSKTTNIHDTRICTQSERYTVEVSQIRGSGEWKQGATRAQQDLICPYATCFCTTLQVFRSLL